ncbi:hypothetical protein EZV62_020029 [Acer yangbiense]|uniref:RIN4 pathogenic type III effector avirulence factor Avr cleavage site domain-containing protein n=1 Tax=Acer yangbiense TaxID=1000413 RepID=A0A5C7HCD0_9ROSI|nr:hypothetical protein EZV62_020029 [Acer yangbiense]
MAQEAGRPLPKFGEWDVNDPASAEGFTVIFTKARDEKKSNANNSDTKQLSQNQRSQATSKPPEDYHHPPMGVCLLIHHFSIKNGSAASEIAPPLELSTQLEKLEMVSIFVTFMYIGVELVDFLYISA